MTIRLLPKTALATLAAAALFLPFGAPLPGSCLRSIGVAGAAPSPSCSSDLRECLRASADLRQTTFGGRYVTADDVARCMEAFRSCTSGGIRSGGNAGPPTSTETRGDGGNGLPQHFAISNDYVAIDCRVSGDAVTCTETMKAPGAGVDSYSGQATGTLNGLTMSGTYSSRLTGHDVGEPSCTYIEEISGPATYTFSRDGSVSMKQGPGQRQMTKSGSCSGSGSSATPMSEDTGKWSAIP